ncbi:Qat anti-phage system QueC-like protein QatC [Streptomyces xanthochromogenes]|uniref:Qat anti-phage system QueC-like protein QatC n=1 Tax=Streptomyces xanthochromogenes TaxID=67384 RepID=UPI003413D41E
MSVFRVRLLPSAVAPAPGETLLDFAPGSAAATVQANATFFSNVAPPPSAADLLLLGIAAYCADRVTPRRETVDAWTRDISLRLPAHAPDTWPSKDAERTLGFLTGDRWDIRAHPRSGTRTDAPHSPVERDSPQADAVCLFSGGLDSLCGVIDLLEGDSERCLLLSHYEGGQTPNAQAQLFQRLRAHYGHRVRRQPPFLRPAPHHLAQDQPLPPERETTSRSRSLLFLTSALALASSVGPAVPVYLPENGYIGVNVPLTPARSGSFSTRTTHPHFLSLLPQTVRAVGINNPLINPYRLMTKGEMLESSRNPELLRDLSRLSVSCSHPEVARYARRPQGNCGYCFPCLIRRASMARTGWDSADDDSWDALSDPALLDTDSDRSADLRAVVIGTRPGRPDRDVLRNGPLPTGERRAFLDVWRRGSTEVRSWLTTGATGALAEQLERIP